MICSLVSVSFVSMSLLLFVTFNSKTYRYLPASAVISALPQAPITSVEADTLKVSIAIFNTSLKHASLKTVTNSFESSLKKVLKTSFILFTSPEDNASQKDIVYLIFASFFVVKSSIGGQQKAFLTSKFGSPIL